jgi:3'-phosphoadenosine 5'-phosphosulfate sulfotransferase (PAPS reductase)/FAD synthetase
MEQWQLDQLQGLPLGVKIEKSKLRIHEAYEHNNGNMYISFSGGKDSVVLIHLIRSIYPDLKAVFLDTGLEYPEIRDFVKTFENVIWIKPKMNFKDVITKYGYPIISKQQSQYIYEARTTKSDKLLDKRLNGKIGSVSKKYQYLINAPFKISHNCCNILKKNPVKSFEKKTGLFPFTGIMANESIERKKQWLLNGCNSFDRKRPISNPISFWTEQDILKYIKMYNLDYCSVYGDIIEGENGNLKMSKLQRTGCMFCMFGIQYDDTPNRFQSMKKTHPKIYDYCIEKLGCGEVLDYLDIDYK